MRCMGGQQGLSETQVEDQVRVLGRLAGACEKAVWEEKMPGASGVFSLNQTRLNCRRNL